MGGWIAMGIVVAACLALVPNYSRRRARRATPRPALGSCRGVLSEHLKQPGDSPEGGDVEGDTPPTAASAPSAGSVVRCQRAVPLSDPHLLSDTVFPGWRF